MASKQRSAAKVMGLGLGALIALMPTFASAAAVDLYYERTVMAAADARCRLFTPNISAALASSQAQARGAALRAGIDQDQLDQVAGRARGKAGSQACNSTSIVTAADRVKTAFAGYSKILKMNYPGDHADWTAERIVSRSGRVWNLSQTATFGADKVTFGIARTEPAYELVAVAQFADGAEPYAARIVMRDTVKARRAYLDYRLAGAKGDIPLPGRMGPEAANRAFLAEAKFEPDLMITPAKSKAAIAYRFPVAASRAMAELDPREAVAIEFLFSGRDGRDTVRRAYIEVGDFAAGQAFLTATAQR